MNSCFWYNSCIIRVTFILFVLDNFQPLKHLTLGNSQRITIEPYNRCELILAWMLTIVNLNGATLWKYLKASGELFFGSRLSELSVVAISILLFCCYAHVWVAGWTTQLSETILSLWSSPCSVFVYILKCVLSSLRDFKY